MNNSLLKHLVSILLFSCTIILLESILDKALAQTPGMIIKPAQTPGNIVLDPNLDGYVSQLTNGVQLGFTIPPDNDVAQSEIPYVPIVRPDPTGDILRGPIGGFIEIVGTDAAGNNAIMVYNDGTNLLFRFRLGGYAPNSKSYSIMIDTDQKFGFTGPNADPNAVSGNPGFELEVVLETNFSVNVYNVDGTINGTLTATHSFDTNAQISMAVSTAGGDPDYFYDFYVPLSDLTPLGITNSTPLRFVAVTVMNPHPAIGNNALSDIGGVTSGSNIDEIFTDLIDSQTPSSIGGINNGGVTDRSACPTINPVSVSSSSITGTSTEASGTTINVSVYQSDGTTLLGSGTTTSGGNWTINLSALSPSVTLAKDQILKATATAAGKGTSIDNCSLQTVTDCGSNTRTNVTVTKISGSKGYTITNTFAAGTIFTWYNADFTVAQYVTKSGGSTYIQNPQTSATAGQLMTFSTETGQTFPNGVFYFTFQEPGKCVSSYLADCQYSSAGTSVAPTITTSVITTSTVSVSGTCGSSAGTLVNLYANGVFLKSTTVVNGTTWTISGLELSGYDCTNITASATDAGKCPTNTVTGVPVSHVAIKPVITTSGCSSTIPLTSVSGNTVEADGSTVTLYKTNPTRSQIGTATVSGGVWTVSSLSLAAGDNVVAAVTSGTCLRTSPDSNPITISSKTNISAYTISINTVKEGQSTVSGTISGGSYPVTLKVYIDGSQVGAGVAVNSSGSWSVSSLLSTDMYTGGVVNVTLTGTGCESDLSAAFTIVQCVQPSTPSYTGGNISYCLNGYGQITLNTSQALVIYQLVNSSGIAVGPSALGTGGAITLHTNILTADLSNVYVKAYKVGFSTCSATSNVVINFTNQFPTPAITITNSKLAIQQGTATTLNLPFSAKSTSPSADNYTINYSVGAKAQGFVDITTPAAVPAAPGNIVLSIPNNPAIGTYTGTVSVDAISGTSCTGNYGFSITVYGANTPPVISDQPISTTICSGNTSGMSVTAFGAGTLTYQWQSSTSFYGPFTNVVGGSGATTASYTTPSLDYTTYYQCVVSNAYGNTTSLVTTVTVNSTPVATGSITGSTTVCAGQSKTYSITGISNASSYTWTYDGSNATINGNSNSISIDYASNATSGTLRVSGSNACGSGNQLSQAIAINPAPFINNMTANGCSGTAFTVTPTNGVNGIVPVGTTYTWGAPVVTGGVTGGVSGSGSNITGTLTNTTGSTQTATYTVTPTNGSCGGSAFTLVVSINPKMNVTATPVDLLCYGISAGSVNLSVSGGTPKYNYLWTGPSSYTSATQNISNLAAGTYNLTVTDSKSCTITTSAVVNQPSAITITPTITAPTCNGTSTGAISLAISGGTGAKIYLWNDGSSSQNRTNLAAGSYSVTVTDANSCTQTSTGNSVVDPTGITASASASAILCNGGSSTITVTASGGSGTLQYSLNGGSYQYGNTFSGVLASASPYIITVKDDNGCTQTTSVTVTQPAAISLSTVITQEKCPGTGNGAITLTVSGGTSPYTYLWNDGNTNEDRSSLSAGTYTVTVKDANNCSAGTSATVTTANPSPVTPGTITK